MQATSAIRRFALPLALLAFAALLRFPNLAHPASVVWDEQHFVGYASRYLEGRFFFDIHPPLGKLMLAGALRLAGAPPTPDATFLSGTPYPDRYPYAAARTIAALAGTLLPLMVYGVGRALGLSRRAAGLAGVLLALDGVMLGESRAAFIDLWVPTFGFAGLWAFFAYRNTLRENGQRRGCFLLLSALLMAASFSVKWTGGGFLLVAAAISAIDASRLTRGLREFGLRAALFGAMFVLLYSSLFYAHLQLLPASGPGNEFVSARFRASLAGSAESRDPTLVPLGTWEKFTELQKLMFTAKSTPNAAGTRFWEWPVGRKPIFLWTDSSSGNAKRLFLVPNPIVWAWGLLGILGLGWVFVRAGRLGRALQETDGLTARVEAAGMLFLAWALNWLPFVALLRIMFIYHYLTALAFSLLLASHLLLDLIPALLAAGQVSGNATEPHSRWPLHMAFIVLALVALAVILLSPALYGFAPGVLLPFVSWLH